MPWEVPEKLSDRIVRLPDEWKVAKYAAAAYEVISYYSGLNIHETMFESFPVHGGSPSEIRLIWLGASLFSLRNELALPDICRRIQERDLRSVFFEASAASFCKELGYYIIPNPERKIKGLDFDFIINNENPNKLSYYFDYYRFKSIINVEVTELRSDSFNVERILNSLNAKRRQLPADKPSMIFCNIPYSWNIEFKSIGDELQKVAKRLFQGTKRVNCVCFSVEHFSDNFEMHVVHYISFLNKNARYRCEYLELSIYMHHRKLNPVDAYSDTLFGRIHEFRQWVDSLIP